MKLGQAKKFLRLLKREHVGNDVRVVISVDPEKVQPGDLIAHIKSLGYAASLQSSAFSEVEVVVTEKVENVENENT